jgi:hypothetical protein
MPCRHTSTWAIQMPSLDLLFSRNVDKFILNYMTSLRSDKLWQYRHKSWRHCVMASIGFAAATRTSTQTIQPMLRIHLLAGVDNMGPLVSGLPNGPNLTPPHVACRMFLTLRNVKLSSSRGSMRWAGYVARMGNAHGLTVNKFKSVSYYHGTKFS